MPVDVVKVLTPAAMSFVVGVGITPLLAHYLYKYKAWKKKGGKKTLYGTEATEFKRLHADTGAEVRAPRMGGIVIWGSVLITIFLTALAATVNPDSASLEFSFLSRSQTWIPLATLIIGALVGLVDDILTIQPEGEGLRLRYRLMVVSGLALFIGWWFWDKLDITTVGIPFGAPLQVGWLIIPLFMLTSLALYASGAIDGIDGLSGGVFGSVFAAYGIIAFMQNQIDLAAFSAACVGGILAFLWFNIPPARFYMSETGSMGLTLTVAVLAFMTDTPGEGIGIAVLPIIGVLLVATVASNIIQMTSRKFRKKKVFRIAPLHHHFEAIGWPAAKVTMRYWVLSIMAAFIGVLIALIGR